MWIDYCNFGRMVFEDPSDVHRLFRRAISFVGKDYLCHILWDKYIDFEFSLKHWSSLADIYIQTLRFPTKKLHHYYDSFKKLVEIWEEEMESHSNPSMTTSVEPMLDNEVSICYSQDDISCIIKDLLDPSIGSARFKALQKYMSIGEQSFQKASQLNEKISYFETRIKRSYFHVKPLDVSQLENWHHYLDFAELHGDFDWAVKLYERCLIPCANYPEFWIRYTEFVESKGGREIAHYALDRATQIFLKRVSVIHLFNARFRERIRDEFNARAAFLQCDTESDSDFVENVVMRSNMEKRLGNFIAASTIYNEAIEKAAAKEKWHILPTLYVNFSRLKHMTNNSEDAARDILIDGIKQVPYCKLLIEELIKFGITHRGSSHLNVIDAIVANAISPRPGVSQGFSATEREQISNQYLEFVDLCGTILDVRKAWNQHIRLFPESVRASLFCPAMGTKQWKITLETHEETHVSLPHQPSGDSGSQCLTQTPLQDKKLSPLENHDTQAAHPATDQVSDQKLPLLENHDMLSNKVSDQELPLLENPNDLSDKNQESVFQAKVDLLQSGEPDNNVNESVHMVYLKVSEPSGKDVEPNLSLDLKTQVADVTESTPASLEFSKENDVHKEHGHEPEQDLKPPSLEGLSLDTQDAKSPGPISPTAYDSGAPDKTVLSDGNVPKSEALKNSMVNENMLESGQNAIVDRIISSPLSTQATASAQTNTGHVSPSSSASNQSSMAHTRLQPQKLENNGKNWHQKGSSDRFRRDSKSGFRGHSHKRMHKQLQSSPQRMHPRAEKDMNRDYPSQSQFSKNLQVQQGGQLQSQYPASNVQANQTASQAWAMHNLQQQNLSHAFQYQPLIHPGMNPQSQMSQHPSQSNEQQGNVQNNQAYNQMWQYYYNQQQQLLWQQQQLLQHQQPQQQQLLQQQYQQQLLQMQYLQQQQQQQQQQQLLLQQQQPYQMQQQQQQLHQQPYQQQHLLYLQQQQLQLQQPQHQQSLQQQKHHPQQQTSSPQQHPHDQEKGQSMQQTNSSLVQDRVSSQPDTDTIESSASPHPVYPN
ncbi:pre-mRNA-processing factor 39-2 isoform X2 [Hevea brasiliensis]|nr:pre-mRNA-processing factor 39-2 isoform X2 [Hevea brasiliensis]